MDESGCPYCGSSVTVPATGKEIEEIFPSRLVDAGKDPKFRCTECNGVFAVGKFRTIPIQDGNVPLRAVAAIRG